LVIEYKGEEHQRFYHLVKHLFKTLDITKYHIYEGKDVERLQVFIEVSSLSLENADAKLQEISDALKEKMVKKWKMLPSYSLPKEYNIVTLPYKRLDE
jgi:L-rhamnose mutarotase